MHHHSAVVPILAWVLALRALAACQAMPIPVLVPASTEAQFPGTPCDPCAEATQIAAQTQAGINLSARQAQATATAGILVAQALATSNAGTATQSAALAAEEINAIALQAQAAATADILRAHALATFNAASSTQGAALTQDSLNASALLAQAAATADVLRADALATLNSASSTQSSALTQAALQQAQLQLHLRLTAEAATQSAAATGTQQWIGAQVGGTATTLAQMVIDQTESAGALAQRSANLRQEQQRGPILFLWKWGLPMFIAAAGVLGLWGFWRWLQMRTTLPRTLVQAFGRPLILRTRGRSLAEQLPSWLRWMVWSVETESKAAAVARPADTVVVSDDDLASMPPAAVPMPWRDQGWELVTPDGARRQPDPDGRTAQSGTASTQLGVNDDNRRGIVD